MILEIVATAQTMRPRVVAQWSRLPQWQHHVVHGISLGLLTMYCLHECLHFLRWLPFGWLSFQKRLPRLVGRGINSKRRAHG